MSYRPRKNKIEINIEGDAFIPAIKASSGTPLVYHSLKEICGRIVFTHWTSETEGLLYMLDKEEIAFKEVGNCQTIPGSTGEYAPLHKTLYRIKHQMSGNVDDDDGITDNPEAWLKERNKEREPGDDPETLDDFHVDELEVNYYE